MGVVVIITVKLNNAAFLLLAGSQMLEACMTSTEFYSHKSEKHHGHHYCTLYQSISKTSCLTKVQKRFEKVIRIYQLDSVVYELLNERETDRSANKQYKTTAFTSSSGMRSAILYF